MNQWASHNPEAYERGEGPLDAAINHYDLYKNEPMPCRVCGEVETRYGKPCPRCERSMEEDRLERESGR